MNAPFANSLRQASVLAALLVTPLVTAGAGASAGTGAANERGAATGTGAETTKRAFTISDFYRVVYPAQIAVSPAGDELVYRLTSRDLAGGKSNADIYRLRLDGSAPQRLTTTDEVSESSPCWSPDGKKIAFVADRGDGEQIWVLPADGGEARQLTSLSTGVSSLRWSPDGSSIAFVSLVYPACGADDACNRERDRLREAIPLEVHLADELLYRHWTTWADGKAAHVLAADAESGEVRDLTPGEAEAPTFFGGERLEFSPDGKALYTTRNPEPVAKHAYNLNVDIWSFPAGAGHDAGAGDDGDDGNKGGTRPKPEDLTAANPAFDGQPVPSPDGKLLAYVSHDTPHYESDLNQLTLLDLATGKSRRLMPGFDFEIEQIAWMPDSRELIFTAAVEGNSPLYRVGAAGGSPKKIATIAHVDELRIARGGRSAMVVRRSVGEPPEIWEVDLAGGGQARRLTRHNEALEQEVDIRPAETMWVEGAGGRKIEVFIVKPHGFDPAKKYPLILNVHGGPQYQWEDAFRGDWQVYPGAGYVVAFPNPTGSTGYGHEFTAAISGDWGGKVYEDVMRTTDALAALPWVDEKRMGAMGWSFGGYMMNWLLGHTDRFQAIASMMGIYDLASFYGGTEELWFPEWDLEGRPWDSGDYQRWNPAAFARQMGELATPTLIITGEKDFRIPYTQSLQLFTTLRRQDVPARLIVLPNSGHWPGWYEMALYYTAHLEWFEKYLGGGGPAWTTTDFAEGRVFPLEAEGEGTPAGP